MRTSLWPKLAMLRFPHSDAPRSGRSGNCRTTKMPEPSSEQSRQGGCGHLSSHGRTPRLASSRPNGSAKSALSSLAWDKNTRGTDTTLSSTTDQHALTAGHRHLRPARPAPGLVLLLCWREPQYACTSWSSGSESRLPRGQYSVLPGAGGGIGARPRTRPDAGNGLTPILARLRIFLTCGIGTS